MESEHVWVEEGTLNACYPVSDDEAEDDEEMAVGPADVPSATSGISPQQTLSEPQVPSQPSSSAQKRQAAGAASEAQDEASASNKRQKEVIEIDSSSDED